MPADAVTAASSRSRRSSYLIVTLVALLASISGVLNDFVYDDIPIIRDNARVHSLLHWREIVSRAYWPPPFVEQLYRPVSVLLLTVQYVLGGGGALPFRLVSYALYAAVAVAVLWLARRLLPSWAALGAAVLFAAHPVHVEAVALGVNQGELLVGLIGVVMVARYLDARRDGVPSMAEWCRLALLYLVAMLTKENGFVLPGLLLAAEWSLVTTPPTPRRPSSRWLGSAMLAVAAVAVVLLRQSILPGHPVEVVTNKALAGLTTGERLLAMLQVVPMWFRLLAWPVHLQAEYGPADIVAPGFGLHEVTGALMVALAVGAVVALRRRQPLLAFGVAWCLVTLLPVSNIVPTGILLAERTLFVPSIGFVLALGALAAAAASRWPGTRTRRALAGACLLLVALGVARSLSRHSVWNSAHLRIVSRPEARATRD